MRLLGTLVHARHARVCLFSVHARACLCMLVHVGPCSCMLVHYCACSCMVVHARACLCMPMHAYALYMHGYAWAVYIDLPKYARMRVRFSLLDTYVFVGMTLHIMLRQILCV